AVVISLAGPSKSGKTVFIEKNIGKDRLIQVTGAGITEADKLWDRVFDIVGTPIAVRSTTGNGFEGTVTGKISGGVPLLSSGELCAAGKWTTSSSEQLEAAVHYLQLLFRELSGTGLVVFSDGFRYIPRSIQVEISNQLKEAIRIGVIFVVASVPYR